MKLKIRTIHGVALAISLIATLVGLVCMSIYAETLVSVWVVSGCVFGATFLAARYFINKYVLYRIKPIYQILLSKNLRTRELPQKGDIVEEIQDDLTHWVDRNAQEIARLKENELFRKQYIGNVSHEIKTPLFSIQGYILTLLDGGLKDDSINQKYLERTERNIERLINIVQDLEDISQYESRLQVMDKEPFDLVQLVREVTDTFEMEAAKKEIRIRIGSELPVIVYADRKRISQVILNLISNAIKYGRQGGHIIVSFIDGFDKIMVEVQDDGIGISEENQPRVFERFFRVDKSRSREQGGTGLGLAIVKHILEAHGETLNLRSRLHEGSTFSFTLSKPPAEA